VNSLVGLDHNHSTRSCQRQARLVSSRNAAQTVIALSCGGVDVFGPRFEYTTELSYEEARRLRGL